MPLPYAAVMLLWQWPCTRTGNTRQAGRAYLRPCTAVPCHLLTCTLACTPCCRGDEDTERRAATRLRERLMRMEAELGQARTAKLEWDTGLNGVAASTAAHGKAAAGALLAARVWKGPRGGALTTKAMGSYSPLPLLRMHGQAAPPRQRLLLPMRGSACPLRAC